MSSDWEARLAKAWAMLDELPGEEFRNRIEQLAAECPLEGGVADFERACSFDSTGHPEQAVTLYQQALRDGLTGIRRRRAVIQLASSLRNIGRPEQSVELLRPELDVSDELDDAIRATLALALVELGHRPRGCRTRRLCAGSSPPALSALHGHGRQLIDPA